MPSTALRALRQHLDDAADVAARLVGERRRPGSAPGRRFRGRGRSPPRRSWAERSLTTTMRGGGPSSSQFAGRAVSSPSRSRPSMSASTTFGRRPGWLTRRPSRLSAPSSAMSSQHLLQPDPVPGLEPERLGDLALADLAGGLPDEGKHRLAGGQGAHRAGIDPPGQPDSFVWMAGASPPGGLGRIWADADSLTSPIPKTRSWTENAGAPFSGPRRSTLSCPGPCGPSAQTE